ncbi:MAG TPA: alpha/beta hydrolase [Steroidobacteraceae bacterium]|nr:alpha/beta hydrolase [Steroidobacteraceae bacterium]
MKKLLPAILLCLGPVLGSPVNAAITQSVVPGADGVRIQLFEDGPGDATRTLLLIPGWLTGAGIWRAQIRYFAARGDRVIALDSRSQGGSSVVYSHNDPESRARDIRAVIADLHLTNLVLVGWSQGVQDVAAYVEQFGTAGISKIVLVDATVSAGPADVSAHPQFVKIVLEHMALYSADPGAYARGFMQHIISTPTAAPVMAALIDGFMKTPPAVGIAMQIEDLFTVDRRAYLKKFDRPTLVIVSDRNPFMTEEKQMADRLSQGRLVVIAHAAHAVFFDQPAAFDHALETFISGKTA